MSSGKYVLIGSLIFGLVLTSAGHVNSLGGNQGIEKSWGFSVFMEGNGRHEETRTPDLYRVKVAL
jgi:hypothetical protein